VFPILATAPLSDYPDEMNTHTRGTSFVTHSIDYDDGDERLTLEERIAQVQRHERCVKRFASLIAPFPLLAMIGFGYETMLQTSYPWDGSDPAIRVLCEIGLASVVCLVVFAGLLMGYRKKLNRLRDQCRSSASQLPELHPVDPDTGTLPGSHPGSDAPGAFEAAAEVNGYDGLLDSPSWRSNRLCG
jgi:hypothetical protein